MEDQFIRRRAARGGPGRVGTHRGGMLERRRDHGTVVPRRPPPRRRPRLRWPRAPPRRRAASSVARSASSGRGPGPSRIRSWPWSRRGRQQTGAKVQYTGTRDINAVLSTGIQSGLLPDLAGLPGPGQMAEYYQAGALKPLDDTLDVSTYKSQTSPGLVELGTIDGKITGIFIKADIKGLFWYNKDVYKAGDPTSYDDLLAKGKQTAAAIGGDAKTFCIGLESGAATGWPATDWIEGFVLHQSGPDVYDKWIAGKQKWSSPEIKQAFQSFGDAVANAFGGSKNVLATNFVASGDHLFSNPPGCVFVNHATFITDAFQKTGGAKPDQFDFFPFPDINPAFAGAVEGSGDLFGMFNDTPQAKSLMAYLATPEAQSIWVGRGGALSANSQVTNYPNDILKKAAARPRRRQALPVRRLGQHAAGHERCLLQGHRRLHPGPVQARLGPDRPRQRPVHPPTAAESDISI